MVNTKAKHAHKAEVTLRIELGAILKRCHGAVVCPENTGSLELSNGADYERIFVFCGPNNTKLKLGKLSSSDSKTAKNELSECALLVARRLTSMDDKKRPGKKTPLINWIKSQCDHKKPKVSLRNGFSLRNGSLPEALKRENRRTNHADQEN